MKPRLLSGKMPCRRKSDCVLDYVTVLEPPEVPGAGAPARHPTDADSPHLFNFQKSPTASRTYSKYRVIANVFVPPEIEQIIESEQQSPAAAARMTPTPSDADLMRGSAQAARSSPENGYTYNIRVVRSNIASRLANDLKPAAYQNKLFVENLHFACHEEFIL